MVSYDLFRLKLKIKTSTRGTNSMPFPFSGRIICRPHRDHVWFGIICGPIVWGSFPVCGSFAVGDHLRSGSFAALYP